MFPPLRSVSSLEILEARIAPAAITTFTEADGDIVRISTSKGLKADLDAAIHGANGKLQLIDFATDPTLAAKFAGTTLTIAVSALGATGDGIADVGYINATGLSLGAVLVKGDLGKIVAGSSDTKPGVASLTVNSLGARGTASGAPDLLSTITGNLGALKVFGDLDEAALKITGKLASATVGGNLIGGSDAGTGSITVAGASGAIKIGGGLEGGSADKTGSLILSTTAKNGAITINGNLVGGGGAVSGSVSGGAITTLFVGGYLNGGTVTSAGTIAATTFTSITVSGNVYGGSADGTGVIVVDGPGTLITVGGSLVGGAGAVSGTIGQHGPGLIGSVTVKGSLVAGTAHDTGELGLTTVGSIFVGGSLLGKAAAVDGGTIQAGHVKSITVVGSLVGDAGAGGASILFLTADTLKVGGSLNGQLAAGSGSIKSLYTGSLEIAGSVFQSIVEIGGEDSVGNSIVAKTVHVGGTVTSSFFGFGTLERANVNVGTVQVDGNWTASDLVVGTLNANGTYGDANDAFAATGQGEGIPTIASITIEGTVAGTVGGTDHYGFVAGKIGAFRAGAFKMPLRANAGNDQVDFTSTQDVTIHEIGTFTNGTSPAVPALPHAVASFVFTDTDGDLVRITSSKGTDLDLQNAVTASPSGAGFQLQKLDLSAAKNQQVFNGANISVSVTALGNHGNGIADVGEIEASGIALGSVLVKGDLGRITAGTLPTKPAIGSLTVNSLGQRLLSTGATDLHSTITGNLGPVKILGDLNHALLDIAGTLGATTVGGNIIGGSGANEGGIKAGGNVGAVKIGGAILGGSGSSAGSLNLPGKVASLFVGGDVAGNTGPSSGSIATGAAGAVFIGGNIGAGAESFTGSVRFSSATSFLLGGNLAGGSTAQSGSIEFLNKSGSVSIGGGLSGRDASSGTIIADAAITTFSIQGAIFAGTAGGSGAILLKDATSIFIGGTVYGNQMAGAFNNSGISAGKVGTVTINGSLIGGGDGTSGTLSLTSATTVTILGDVNSFGVLSAGNIHATESIGTLEIGGFAQRATFLIGSAASKAGSTVATKVHVGGAALLSNFFFGSLERADVKVGTVTVDGDWFRSNLLVGAINLGADDLAGGDPDNINFGDGHDHRAGLGTPALSSIASIVIEGRIQGTSTNGDHYGFVAGKIGAFRAGAFTLPLHATGAADVVTLTSTGDVTVTEQLL